MRKVRLPREVAVSAFCGGGAVLHAEVTLADLPRLRQSVSGGGPLEVQLGGSEALDGRSRVQGSVAGALELTCSRCLELFTWPLQLAFAVIVVGSEAEESRLMHECETWLAEGDRLPLWQHVEDEIMLALPLLPRCGRTGCSGESRHF